MEGKKKVLIGILSVLVCIMAIGYALLAQELTINGSASIDSLWKIEITNIASKDVVGDAVNKVYPSYIATTANFSVWFTQPRDSITYDIEVTNKGKLDAVVESITVNKGDNPAITYTTSSLKRGNKILKNNGTNTLTIKVDYDSNVTSQPASTTNDITVTINYQQDLGQVVAYDYEIGDMVTFAGSNWYVIKNSNSNEDYVALIKERVLTNAELGNYAYNGTYDTMEYTWTETCHEANRGYSSYDFSNCDNTNGYATSKVKEFLEGTYINTLGADNLKEVDGYKIRLITLEELQQNLGTSTTITASWYDIDTTIAPSWVCRNFGNVFAYWTMTPNPDNSSGVWYVLDQGGKVQDSSVLAGSKALGVRPVINILKNSI